MTKNGAAGVADPPIERVLPSADQLSIPSALGTFELPFAEIRPLLSGHPIRRSRRVAFSGAVEVRLIPEADGGFSVYAPSVPGVVSQGETEDEALAMIREALQGAIEAYRDLGEELPFRVPEPCPRNEEVRWIKVDG